MQNYTDRVKDFFDAIKENNIEQVISLIKDNEGLVNAKDNNDWTALHLAAESDNAETVKALIGAGASLSVKDNDGKTPLDIARERHHYSSIVTILEDAITRDRKRKALTTGVTLSGVAITVGAVCGLIFGLKNVMAASIAAGVLTCITIASAVIIYQSCYHPKTLLDDPQQSSQAAFSTVKS